MGRRGPPPTPTNIVKLRGNPGKRALNDREPTPSPARPPCPSWLAIDAKREWRRLVPTLERLGVLTAIDQTALAGYCQSYARWRQAEQEIEGHLTLEIYELDDQGERTLLSIKPHPAIAISQKERQIMRTYLALFGLSPADRSRIKASVPDKDDGIDALLG